MILDRDSQSYKSVNWYFPLFPKIWNIPVNVLKNITWFKKISDEKLRFYNKLWAEASMTADRKNQKKALFSTPSWEYK